MFLFCLFFFFQAEDGIRDIGVTGVQTCALPISYPRKVDAQVVSSLAGVAASVHRFANDVRLLAGMKQIEEPFEAEQVGSSAMAYKRNPMRCERATGLCRFVISLASSPLQTAAEQWFERTLDDSSNKRLAVPDRKSTRLNSSHANISY